jgi:DNA replication protein DnaC
VLVIDEVGYLTYGPDAANVLFHVVNDRAEHGRIALNWNVSGT